MTAPDPRVGEIPADAIEAVAQIVYRTSGRKRVMSYEQARAQCESDAREILEAALPHMVADAGAKALEDAALLEAQARAYDKGYTHGRHDGEHHLTYRISHTPRPETSRRNPYRAAVRGEG